MPFALACEHENCIGLYRHVLRLSRGLLVYGLIDGPLLHVCIKGAVTPPVKCLLLYSVEHKLSADIRFHSYSPCFRKLFDMLTDLLPRVFSQPPLYNK